MAGRKLFAVAAALFWALLPGALRAQSPSDSISVRMVSADSLVRAIRIHTGTEVHIAKAEADGSLYSVSSSRGTFLDKALEKFRQNGYSVSEWGGRLYLIHGKGLQTGIEPTWWAKQTTLSLASSEETSQEATYINKIYEIGDESHPSRGKVTIRGHVKDIASGEPVPGISVFDDNTQTFAITDAYGSYQLVLPVGRNAVNFAGYPMEDIKLEVVIYGAGGLDVNMKEKVTSLRAASVSAESVSYHRSTTLGVEKIQLDRIKKIPAAFGESDLIKAVLALPGVQSVGEASSGFNVRGGSVDQNLILFNDGTIYNPNHMFGIFSAFNSDIISDAELYKSSIPAEYGGRISSVLDIHSRDGNSKKVTGSLGLGLLTSRFEIEGPIAKDKTTFVLGGRTTYSNWMLGLIPDDSHYHDGKTSFQDANASLAHRFNDRNSLYVYGYFSRDAFSFSTDTDFAYYNMNFSAKLRSILTSKTTMEISAGMDTYHNQVDSDQDYEYGAYRYSAQIQQEWFKAKFKSIVSSAHTLTYGVNATYYDISPGKMKPSSSASGIARRSLDQDTAIEPSVYLNDTWTISEKAALDFGVRLNSFASTAGDTKWYAIPEARLSGKYSFLPNLTAKAGFNTLRQNIHLVTNTSTISPMDAWTLASDRIKPQDGYQAAGGLYWTVGSVDLSLEGYYKASRNTLDYKSGSTLIMNENLPDDLVKTKGRSYGVELMARKATGALNGWISYTYSRSQLKDTTAPEDFPINGGNWYKAPHDKPHSLKSALNYKFTHRYSISANLDYSTGRPITVPIGYYEYGGKRRLAYSERNEYRIPDYFRLDLALNVEPGHYLKRLTHLSFTLGVYNVTGRKNAYSVYYTMEDGAFKPAGYMISVFATQIPYINLNLKF